LGEKIMSEVDPTRDDMSFYVQWDRFISYNKEFFDRCGVDITTKFRNTAKGFYEAGELNELWNKRSPHATCKTCKHSRWSRVFGSCTKYDIPRIKRDEFYCAKWEAKNE
jgi:hypothetical protein